MNPVSEIFFGQDEFRVRDALHSRLNVLVPRDERHLCVFRFDGGKMDTPGLETAVQTPVMFSAQSVIVVDHFESVPKKSRSGIIKTLSERHSSVSLLISFWCKTAKDAPEKELLALGHSVRFDLLKEHEAAKWLQERAAASSMNIELAAARLIVERIGLTDTGRLAGELTKYPLLLSSQRPIIDVKMAKALTPISKESGTFQLVDAVADRKIHEAVKVLDGLGQSSSDMIGTLMGFTHKFLRLAAARVALDTNQKLPLIGNDAPWMMEKVSRQAKNWTAEEVRAAVLFLAYADQISKRGAPARALVEQFVYIFTQSPSTTVIPYFT